MGFFAFSRKSVYGPELSPRDEQIVADLPIILARFGVGRGEVEGMIRTKNDVIRMDDLPVKQAGNKTGGQSNDKAKK
jgi:hypothetical protein